MKNLHLLIALALEPVSVHALILDCSYKANWGDFGHGIFLPISTRRPCAHERNKDGPIEDCLFFCKSVLCPPDSWHHRRDLLNTFSKYK